MELIKLIEDDFFVNENDFPERDENWKKIYDLHVETVENMKFTYKSLRIGTLFVFFCYICKNATTYLLNIPIYPDGDRSSDPWLTPFLVHRHDDFEPVIFYHYAFTLQGLVLVTICTEGYLTLLLLCLSTERVLGDFEIIYQLVNLFCKDYSDTVEEELRTVEKGEESLETFYMMTDINRIVQLHQRITRNYKSISINSRYLISNVVISIMCVSCVSTYFILKSNTVARIAVYVTTFFMLNVLLFLVYENGQRIFNQNELLRKCLADLPWTDKPYWLRKTVHLMMTRANVDIEIKPYGIYALNYMSFKDLMKLTYSVANVLYTRNRHNYS